MKNFSLTPSEKKWLKWLLFAAGLEIVGLVVFVLPRVWTQSQLLQPQPTEVIETDQGVGYWSGNVRAWIDENRNGIKDIDEQPLREVTVYLDLGGGIGQTSTAVTDPQGKARLEYPWLDIDGTDQVVYVTIPAGYELTTPARVGLDHSNPDQVFDFGFAYLPGIPTVTPFPPKPICKSYKLGRANVFDLTDLSVTPNGTVWVASYGNGVYALPPNGADWINYKQSAGLVGDQVRSITVERDDSIWFATEQGASHFDGKTWTSYTTSDGLIDNEVSKIVVDGRLIWFATYSGVSMLDLDTKAWRSFTVNDGLANKLVFYGAIARDGSVWFSTFEGYSRLTWLYRPVGGPEWMTYKVDDGGHIEARPDGTIWFGAGRGISIFDPQSSKWKSFDIPRQGLIFDTLNTFAFAPDGSLWIGSGDGHNVIYHVLDGPSDNPDLWRSYDSSDGLPAEINRDDKIEAIAFAPDGAVWVATHENATRCVFQGQ
jgi:streptogramin lyase